MVAAPVASAEERTVVATPLAPAEERTVVAAPVAPAEEHTVVAAPAEERTVVFLILRESSSLHNPKS